MLMCDLPWGSWSLPYHHCLLLHLGLVPVEVAQVVNHAQSEREYLIRKMRQAHESKQTN